MKIVTAAEMRALDRATSERFGVPSLTLMENAGSAVAEHVLAHYPGARKVVVVCGKGNNGGDGFVAARRLHEKDHEKGHEQSHEQSHEQRKTVQVILLADPAELKGDAAAMYGKLPVKAVFSCSSLARSGSDLKDVCNSLGADLYIDAILGTGFKPPVSGLYADAIAFLNASSVPVVAVDIPSGADADTMTPQKGTIARADSIVTFTAPRPAHVFSPLTEGPIYVAPIGSPAEAIVSSLQLNVITARDFAPLIDKRPADSNKGLYGHVLVVGGSVGKAGAVAMAGMSVLRAGAGLATVATAKSALATVAGFHPELMTEPLPETRAGSISAGALERLDKLAKDKTVLAIGPGISRVEETSELVRALVSRSAVPVVLDADGLNAFEGRAGELNGKDRLLVITPHPGEMARLAGCSIADVQKDRLGVARRFAREHELIVVLKGHRTLVVQPDGEAWVNTTGNPGMSTGGTGDILTGIVAGMLAQETAAESRNAQKMTVQKTTAQETTAPNQRSPLLAVCAAVHLHGLAGDVMRETVGEHSLVATDLLRGLPEAFRRARQATQQRFVRWSG
jgi:ADP-dependent NAD(P)H-hydrate dehydratase / NAD(P)H-hydrate epimerase